MKNINEKLAKNLKLLSLLDIVFIAEDNSSYQLTVKNSAYNKKQIVVFIDKHTDKIQYCMTGLYDNGSNVEEIDLERLNILQDVVKQLMEA